MSKNGQIYLDPSSTLWMKGLMLLPQVLQKVPMIRSSHPEVFCKKDVLRTFAKFTGKHLCLSTSGLQLYQKRKPVTVVCEFCTVSKNIFSYRTPPAMSKELRPDYF